MQERMLKLRGFVNSAESLWSAQQQKAYLTAQHEKQDHPKTPPVYGTIVRPAKNDLRSLPSTDGIRIRDAFRRIGFYADNSGRLKSGDKDVSVHTDEHSLGVEILMDYARCVQRPDCLYLKDGPW